VKTNEIASVLVAVLVLAGITVAIVNGGQTASVLNASGSAFSNVIKAATGKG
jgi:hypothetical protein